MSNKVDKLFRENLASGKFVPSSDEWAKMEKLIETDLGGTASGANGSGISINILFTSFFVFLLSSGVILSQMDSDLNPFSNKRANATTHLETKNQEENNGKEAIPSNNSKIKGSNNASSFEVRSSENKTSSTKVIEKNTPILINGIHNSIEENNMANGKGIGFVLNEDSQGNTIFNEQDNSESTKNNSKIAVPDRNENISVATKGIISSNSSNSENVQQNSISETSNYSTVETQTNSRSNSPSYTKGEAQLNALSNTPNHTKGDPQLNESFDFYLNQLNDSQANKDSRFLNPNSSNLFGKSLFLSSQTITSFSDLKKQEGVARFDGKNNLFKASPQKNRNKFPLQFSIAAFGEAAWISKKITGDAEFTSLINTRNEQEKSVLKFNAGIEFQAKYKGFGINTGFSTGNYGENIQYEEKYYSEWEVTNNVLSDTLWTQEIEFIYDTVFSPIDSTWIWMIVDSTFVTVIDSIILTNQYDSTEVLSPLGLTKHNGKTNVSYWEIPLYFSYQFEIDDFYLSPGLGVTFGFWKMSKAYYMAKDEQSLIPINTEYYVLKKTIINANLMLGVGYKIGDQFSIELTPSFKFNVNNIFKEDDIIQKYKSLSLQLRLRYYF